MCESEVDCFATKDRTAVVSTEDLVNHDSQYSYFAVASWRPDDDVSGLAVTPVGVCRSEEFCDSGSDVNPNGVASTEVSA